MKTLLPFLIFFSILATPCFAQDKLRVKNYTERPDTEPPYDRPFPGNVVKIKKTGTTSARTASPTTNRVRRDTTLPGPKIPIKAKTPSSSGARRSGPTRRPSRQ